MLKRIKPDNYLEKFVDFCKEKYKDELIAIGVYGSFAWGYFDKSKSDYDVFVIFKNKTPKGRKEINKKFPKVTLQYFATAKEIEDRINQGHFTIYITFLKSARMLYSTKEYRNFLKKIKKTDIIERLIDTLAIEGKTKFEVDTLGKLKGYKASKWALPSIRKRLQFLTYLRKRKATWNLKKVLKLNKDLLDKDEIKFIIDLDKRVKKRENVFSKKDREISIEIIKRLNYEIVFKELKNL
jgi:predicted nucleotidyltransferase